MLSNAQDFTSAREKVLYQKDENTVGLNYRFAWSLLTTSLPDCICRQTFGGDDLSMHSDETMWQVDVIAILDSPARCTGQRIARG